MMQGFKDVDLQWNGVTYTLRAKGILNTIAEIEDALIGSGGVPAVAVLMRPGGPTHSRLSKAYAAALRGAGAAVTEEEIYLAIAEDFANGKADAAIKVRLACFALLAIMAPPLAMALSKAKEDDEPGEA